jgi:hypothetical protein
MSPGEQVQVPAGGLGDLPDGRAFVADGVEHRAGGSLRDGQLLKSTTWVAGPAV